LERPSDELFIKSARCDRSLSISSFTLATTARRNPSSSAAEAETSIRYSSANQRPAIHDGHDHDPSVAADVLAELKGLVGGDHPTMLRNGIVGRLAEFPAPAAEIAIAASRAAMITTFIANLSDVDVPNPGFVK
jgi:hypothetical protein